MADPAKYNIDAILNTDTHTAGLHIERSCRGEWIKVSDFEDYKAARRRNSTEDAVTRLGIEIAELRCRIADLEGGCRA